MTTISSPSTGFSRALAVSLFACLLAGCSTLELYPVHGAEGPSVIIKTNDVGKVKSAIVELTAPDGYKPESLDAGENLWVSRRLSAVKVLLLSETMATKNDKEEERFHIETVPEGVRIYVGRVEQMELPGGRLNEDPLLDNDQYEALKKLLGEVKERVERG